MKDSGAAIATVQHMVRITTALSTRDAKSSLSPFLVLVKLRRQKSIKKIMAKSGTWLKRSGARSNDPVTARSYVSSDCEHHPEARLAT